MIDKLNLELEPLQAAVIEQVKRIETHINEFYRKFFAICRVCLSSGNDVSLTSLFDENETNAEMFETITGLKILNDKEKYEALICEKCLDGVKKAFELEEHIRDIDKSFFEVKRNEHAEALTSHNKPSAQTNPDINEKVIEPSSITAAITSYKCSKCPKAYSLQSYLNQHIRLRHTSVPKFCCAVCPMKFIRRGPFLEHEKHHKENPNFKSKTKNTSDSTRPFQCMLKGCSKYFKDRKGLKAHQEKVHCASPTKFACPICGKLFKYKNSILKHNRKKHAVNVNASSKIILIE